MGDRADVPMPIWKFYSIHAQNGSFVPNVCRLRDILSQYIPIYDDIIDAVLIPFVGLSQIASVRTTASTIKINQTMQQTLSDNLSAIVGNSFDIKLPVGDVNKR